MSIEKIRDGLYIKKDRFGYRIVYPFKNEDGSWNYFNFFTGGSWWKLIKVVIIVLFILGMSWSYYHDVKACRDLQENICDYFLDISSYCISQQTYLEPIDWGNIEVINNGTEP